MSKLIPQPAKTTAYLRNPNFCNEIDHFSVSGVDLSYITVFYTRKNWS